MDTITLTLTDSHPLAGQEVEALIARPDAAAQEALPRVLFFMDAFGLRPQIESMMRRIADWGYLVVAPNTLFRSGSVDELAPTADLREPGEREKAFESLMPGLALLTPEVTAADAAAYVDAVLALDESDAATDSTGPIAPVGVVGYCMGARFAVNAAARADRVAAVAGFHGGRLVVDDPHSPHLALATAGAEFVFGHADHDPSMPPEQIQALGQALEAAGLPGRNEVYAEAPHGFTMADTSSYQEAGAERAFVELESLLARRLL